MTNIDDYKKPDGHIDWAAYKAAQIRVGEICRRCQSYIIFGGSGYARLCRDCIDLDTSPDEVTNDHAVRCPACRHIMEIADSDLYTLYESGTHDVSCLSCNHDFEVQTEVSYSFTSPELIDASEDTQEGVTSQ